MRQNFEREIRLRELTERSIIGRPQEFEAGGRRFRLYPASLGRSLVTGSYLRELFGDGECPGLEELVRLSRERSETVSIIISLSTLRGRDEVTDTALVEERASYFRRTLGAESLAELLLASMSEVRAEELMELSGLSDEHRERSLLGERRRRHGRTVTYGGKTLYGRLVGPACEAMHCVPETVIWEVSLLHLRMVLSDRIESVYLDEEEASLTGRDGMETIDAERTPIEELMRMTGE